MAPKPTRAPFGNTVEDEFVAAANTIPEGTLRSGNTRQSTVTARPFSDPVEEPQPPVIQTTTAAPRHVTIGNAPFIPPAPRSLSSSPTASIVDGKLDNLDSRFNNLDSRFNKFSTDMVSSFQHQDTRINSLTTGQAVLTTALQRLQDEVKDAANYNSAQNQILNSQYQTIQQTMSQLLTRLQDSQSYSAASSSYGTPAAGQSAFQYAQRTPPTASTLNQAQIHDDSNVHSLAVNRVESTTLFSTLLPISFAALAIPSHYLLPRYTYQATPSFQNPVTAWPSPTRPTLSLPDTPSDTSLRLRVSTNSDINQIPLPDPNSAISTTSNPVYSELSDKGHTAPIYTPAAVTPSASQTPPPPPLTNSIIGTVFSSPRVTDESVDITDTAALPLPTLRPPDQLPVNSPYTPNPSPRTPTRPTLLPSLHQFYPFDSSSRDPTVCGLPADLLTFLVVPSTFPPPARTSHTIFDPGLQTSTNEPRGDCPPSPNLPTLLLSNLFLPRTTVALNLIHNHRLQHLFFTIPNPCQYPRTPTVRPFHYPTRIPSSHPSRQPTSLPTAQPNSHPSSRPSCHQFSKPSRQPSPKPTSLLCNPPRGLLASQVADQLIYQQLSH